LGALPSFPVLLHRTIQIEEIEIECKTDRDVDTVDSLASEDTKLGYRLRKSKPRCWRGDYSIRV